MPNLKQKELALHRLLRSYDSVVIAFSGGLDSSVLLAAAARVLPSEKLLAVTARSATYPEAELRAAEVIAGQLKVPWRLIKSDEFRNPRFVANPRNRCYYCKRALFSRLTLIARKEGFATVLDGTNADDRYDYRPGAKAAVEFNVRHPLQQAGLTKDDLRRLARRYHLPNWNKPAAACLASRLPYGTRLTPGLLRRIERAEDLLHQAGFTQVRVRSHNSIARIEVLPSEFRHLLAAATRKTICTELERLGWKYITMDLAGYRTGSMNR